jgi:hypothetical protein
MDRSRLSPSREHQARRGPSPFLSWIGQVVATLLAGPGAIVVGDPGPSPAAGVATFMAVLVIALVAWSMLALVPWPAWTLALVVIGSWLLARRLRP